MSKSKTERYSYTARQGRHEMKWDYVNRQWVYDDSKAIGEPEALK